MFNKVVAWLLAKWKHIDEYIDKIFVVGHKLFSVIHYFFDAVVSEVTKTGGIYRIILYAFGAIFLYLLFIETEKVIGMIASLVKAVASVGPWVAVPLSIFFICQAAVKIFKK
jgi:hypothetical protein